MTPFRQPIRPGNVGSDVWAVKRAYIRMGVKGAGALAATKTAGPAFVRVTEAVQQQHSQHVDGIYGPHTHAVVAPHFDAYGIMLYRSAKIRVPPLPPVPVGDAKALAKKLLGLREHGRYQADNPGDLRDIEAAAAGRAVWSQGGYLVHLDSRPLRLLVWLIENEGFKIGTFALCSDHHNDGPHGHAGGLAVDISSVNGVSIASAHARALTLEVAEKINRTPGLRPRQQICDGYGYMHDSAISACTIPSAGFYGPTTMSEHRNHIHAGY